MGSSNSIRDHSPVPHPPGCDPHVVTLETSQLSLDTSAVLRLSAMCCRGLYGWASNSPLCYCAWYMGPHHREFNQTILSIFPPSPCSLGLKTGVLQGWPKKKDNHPSPLKRKKKLRVPWLLSCKAFVRASLVAHINKPQCGPPHGPSSDHRPVCI